MRDHVLPHFQTRVQKVFLKNFEVFGNVAKHCLKCLIYHVNLKLNNHHSWITVSPLKPGRPSTPRLPAAPASPLSPVCPIGPAGPGRPRGPGEPAAPCSPLAPGAPLPPVSPVSPGKPCGVNKRNPRVSLRVKNLAGYLKTFKGILGRKDAADLTRCW